MRQRLLSHATRIRTRIFYVLNVIRKKCSLYCRTKSYCERNSKCELCPLRYSILAPRRITGLAAASGAARIDWTARAAASRLFQRLEPDPLGFRTLFAEAFLLVGFVFLVVAVK